MRLARLLLALAVLLACGGIAAGPPRAPDAGPGQAVSALADGHVAVCGGGTRLSRQQAQEAGPRPNHLLHRGSQEPRQRPPGAHREPCPVAPCLVVGSAASGQPRASRGPPA